MANYLDLHIIRNFPLSCLVRDENGSPKTMTFGGTTRARISSQSEKRPIRLYEKELDKVHFGGIRTRAIATDILNGLTAKGMSQDLANSLSNSVADEYGTLEKEKTKTVLFFSAGEINAMVNEIISAEKEGKIDKLFKTKKKDGKVTYKFNGFSNNLLKNSTIVDIADIAMFGRMVASAPDLSEEGASSFAHMFSVHTCENEIDFFSAVDESSTKSDTGSGHIGELEFNSACYYGCISVNLNIFNESRLKNLPMEARKDILKLFIESCIVTVPGARHNSMFAATMPSSVLGLVRKNTFPLSLANAYEKPIRPSSNGYTEEARKRLELELNKTKETYGRRFGLVKELWFPDNNLDFFMEGLVDNA